MPYALLLARRDDLVENMRLQTDHSFRLPIYDHASPKSREAAMS